MEGTLAELIQEAEEAIGAEGIVEELARQASVWLETVEMLEDMRSKAACSRINDYLAVGRR